MGGNSFGTLFTALTFGESHGPAVGCVVDGCPAGVPLDTETIRRDLARRRPGAGGPVSARREDDEPEILSGVFRGKTLGTPIAITVRNGGARSSDYDALKDVYRPGHADWTWEAKYGVRDYRGGGRSSGRETVGRVAAGAVARAFLSGFGIGIRAWTGEAAGFTAPGPEHESFNLDEAERNALRMPHRETAERALLEIENLRGAGDSAGGVVACRVSALPPGLGEPVFEKLDALIAHAMLSIGAAKGVEFGAGFSAASLKGSQMNDRPVPAPAETALPGGTLPPGVPAIGFAENRAGGVLGGLSTGMPLEFRVVFKPPPSIARAQETRDRAGGPRIIEIPGRHDICVCPRAVPVVEAMAALVLADLLLQSRVSR
ncbi:MAG: chorismate synthase [Spirochaetaceae bacterium]|jgi:chorismate synthase|nr:chorismate synthase [Spirochaetaceae bacterium]